MTTTYDALISIDRVSGHKNEPSINTTTLHDLKSNIAYHTGTEQRCWAPAESEKNIYLGGSVDADSEGFGADRTIYNNQGF